MSEQRPSSLCPCGTGVAWEDCPNRVGDGHFHAWECQVDTGGPCLPECAQPTTPRGSTQTPLERQYEVAKRRNVGLDRFSLAPRRKATK